jgi:hypothetical protein
MTTPAFTVGLPLGNLTTGVYTPPVTAAPTATYPGVVTNPAAGLISTPDTYLGQGAQIGQVANPALVGGLSGYKAPRGLEHVRTKLNINMYGQRVYRASGRGGGRGGYNNYGGGRGGYNSNSRGWGNNNSYRSMGGNGGPRVGQSGFTPAFGVWAAVKSSVIWGTVLSAGINGYQYFNKQETGAQAGANVSGDVVSSVVGGAAGALVSYAGGGMLAAMGMSGIALSLTGIGLGIAGFFVADQLLRKTPMFQSFQSGVYKMFGGQ